MSALVINYCIEHGPQEVEYVCGSFAWSAFYFTLGWLLTILTVLLTGGRK